MAIVYVCLCGGQEEHAFSKMKAHLRRHHALAEILSPEEMIVNALGTVTGGDMNNWLRTDWASFWLRANG